MNNNAKRAKTANTRKKKNIYENAIDKSHKEDDNINNIIKISNSKTQTKFNIETSKLFDEKRTSSAVKQENFSSIIQNTPAILRKNYQEETEKNQKRTSKKKEDKKKEEPIIQNTLSGASVPEPVLVPGHGHGHGSLSGGSGSFKVKKNIVDTINPFED